MSRRAADWLRSVLVSVVLTGAMTQAAFASPGCTSLNGSNSGGSFTGSFTGMDFEVGDVITLVLTDAGSTPSTLYLQNSTTVTQLTATLSSSGSANSYFVPANTTDTFVIGGTIGAGGIASWSCFSGKAGGSSYYEQLRQIHGLSASLAATAISSMLTDIVSNLVRNKITYLKTNDDSIGPFGPNGILMVQDGGLPTGAYGLGMGSASKRPKSGGTGRTWDTWADGRISGNGGDDIKGRPGRFSWDHLMIASGAHYVVAPGILVGGFGSLENFGSERTDTASKLDGRGVSLGGYGAWQITRHLMFDGNITHTWLDYDGLVGAVGSEFTGSRWIMSSRLSGLERVGKFLVAPQAEVSWLREEQGAFVTSLGAPVNAQHFVSGGANTGLVVSLPLPMKDGLVFLPFVGSFADYRFGVEDKSSGTILGFGDGWSLRMRGGATVSSGDAWSITLDGDLGNVGGKGGEYYTGHLNGSLRF